MAESTAVTGPSQIPIRECVEKILASGIFAASERMSRFLRFAVERVLEGHGEELKEYLLGVEIFDRSASYDPRVDPIVRVEARRLRSKLKAYYETEGRNDAVIIEFPTGTYVPRFRQRREPAVERAEPVEETAEISTFPAGNIAVLPFANLSPDPDSEYFSDGLTEELIHALTKVERLHVVAWGSAVKLKERQHDLRSIGQQLRVGTILLGSVRKSGNRLRVIARLVDTCSGQYLWSETYDRKVEDVFAIQEQISQAIVSSLRIKLLGAGPGAMIRGPWNFEAYDLYLRGRFHMNTRTPDGLERAIQQFQQAITVDPKFAPGHAGLADAYALCADYGLSLPDTIMPKAKAAALLALEIDPNLGEAHASLAFILSLHEWQWEEAGEHYRQAIEMNPGYASAHHWYSCDYLALRGRFDEAVAEMEWALRLDPLSQIINEGVAYVLMLARRYDEAIEKNLRTMELDPHFYKTYPALGRVFIQKGMYGKAIEMLQKGRELAGDLPSVLGALGQAYALDGDAARARTMLEQLGEMAKRRHVPSTCFAVVHCGLGEKHRALRWLELGCERHELPICCLKVHPCYDPLRDEPRFAAMVKKIGLA